MAWVYLHVRSVCYKALGLLAGLLVGAVGSTLRAVLALLGEEFRRWAGLVAWGAVIFLAGKATMKFAPAGTERPLALTVLLLAGIWAIAAMRAARYTLHNSLRLVRQRLAFRDLRSDVGRLGERWDGMVEGLANRTRGTRRGRMFRSNRQAEDAAAEQAERDQRAAEADEQRRDELAALEPNPY